MSIPHVGWPVGADADEPSGRGGTPAAARVAGSRGSNTTPAAQGARGSRRRPGGSEYREGSVAGPAVSVLADRLAAALVHHEPGWRLPRHSALARRYNVSAAEIDAAVEELASRHLVRRLADGQVYRASPAEYVIDFEGVPGLASHVDAMGGKFSCRSRQVSWRLPPEDISWALRVPADQQVCVVRYLWTANGEPAALSTTYIPADIAASGEARPPAALPSILNLLQLSGGVEGAAAMHRAEGSVSSPEDAPAGWPEDAPAGRPGAASVDRPQDASVGRPPEASVGRPDAARVGPPEDTRTGPRPVALATALHIEMQAPPPSVARSLRLTSGQSAMLVTVRFDAPDTGRPAALTITVLRPEMFRVVLQTPSPPLPDGDAGNLSGSWTHAIEGFET
jgi:DNA-binding GntR family transcriptional regulator